MLKSILNLKETQELSKREQNEISGGFGPSDVVCVAPQFNSGPTCPSGTHPHPTHGACICCAN
ncbi:hypothetical protein GTQ40_10620 [Flavobacteriaceae bacterium R38]|nr:hypothetical protein [Flavobacteriaceae bacterium R38]